MHILALNNHYHLALSDSAKNIAVIILQLLNAATTATIIIQTKAVNRVAVDAHNTKTEAIQSD